MIRLPPATLDGPFDCVFFGADRVSARIRGSVP